MTSATKHTQLSCQAPSSLTRSDIRTAASATSEYLQRLTSTAQPRLWWRQHMAPPFGFDPDGLSSRILDELTASGYFSDGAFHGSADCTRATRSYWYGSGTIRVYVAQILDNVCGCGSPMTDARTTSGDNTTTITDALATVGRTLQAKQAADLLLQLPAVTPAALAAARRVLHRAQHQLSNPRRRQADPALSQQADAVLADVARTVHAAQTKMADVGWLTELAQRYWLSRQTGNLVSHLRNNNLLVQTGKDQVAEGRNLALALQTLAADGTLNWALDTLPTAVAHKAADAAVEYVRNHIPADLQVPATVDSRWEVTQVPSPTSHLNGNTRHSTTTAAHTLALLWDARQPYAQKATVLLPALLHGVFGKSQHVNVLGPADPTDSPELLAVITQLQEDGTDTDTLLNVARNALTET